MYALELTTAVHIIISLFFMELYTSAVLYYLHVGSYAVLYITCIYVCKYLGIGTEAVSQSFYTT